MNHVAKSVPDLEGRTDLPAERQLQIDFTRAEQLALIRDARIPPAAGISAHAVKSVLVAIDQFARGRECWASQVRIAAVANLSRRVCQRAIGRLIDLSLVTCDRVGCAERTDHRGGVTNRYRIVWSELAVLSPAVSMRCAHPRQPDGARIPPSHHSRPAPTAPTNAPLEPTNAPPGPTNAPPWRTKRLEPLETTTAPPPPPTEPGTCSATVNGCAGLAADVELQTENPIAELLRDAGLAHWRTLGVEFARLDAHVVSAAIATYRANVSRLAGPGALVSFLRTGVWPRDGLIDPAQDALADERRAAKRRQAAREAACWELVRTARRRGDSEETIRAELDRRGLSDVYGGG